MPGWKPIPRRSFLRGMGTAVSLPLLDGMLTTPGRGHRAAYADGHSAGYREAPLRLAFMYVPNGAHMPDWTPTAEGIDFDLPMILEPLAESRDDVLIVSGLAHDKAKANGDGPGDHARSAATFLTGAQAVKTDGKDIRVGESVDQVAARHLGDATRLRSLEIGCEFGQLSGECDSGYSCAYSNSISWTSPTTPALKEVNPALVFDRLFGSEDPNGLHRSQASRDRDRASVLDFVAEDARSLRSQLGKGDQHKLDEYLESVREVERAIQQPSDGTGVDGHIRRPRGIPEDYAQHVRLMGELMVLAFQTDSTRICTFMVANAGSDKAYPEIDIHMGHHTISHHQDDAEKQAQISRINRYHTDLLGYILRRLKATPDGETTLLDNTMLVYGSGISDGNRHNHDDLPILLAGGGCGAIDGGRHIRVADDTPLTNLYLTMLQQAGVPVDQFGDSTGILDMLRAG